MNFDREKKRLISTLRKSGIFMIENKSKPDKSNTKKSSDEKCTF